MVGETPITIIGNLVADPELRYTPNGAAVANFRIASTAKRYDKNSGQWTDQDPLFLSCSVWKQPAENVAESLKRGDRVIATGSLRQRAYETTTGEKRTVIEMVVEEIGPSLRFSTTATTKIPRSSGATNNPAPHTNSGNPDNPWESGPFDAPPF